MKAAWCISLMSCALACGGTDEGPRGQLSQAGTAGTAPVASAGSTSVGAAGTGGSANVTGGAPSAGTSSVAGSGGSVTLGGTGGAIDPGPGGKPGQRTVVYLPDYRGALSTWATQIDFSRMTYLNLCFAEVDAAGNVSYADPGLDAFVAAAHAKGVKVCMAIGGATVIENGGVYATVLQDGMRDTLVNKLGEFAANHQLDCIDVDLEGNGVNQYYEAFVTSLASKLHAQNKEMTSAVSSWFGDKITDKAIQAFDFINVMAYDLHNPGGSTQPVQSSSIEEATAEVEYWTNRGLAKNKAVFGVPFYGYKWAGSKGEALTYAEILSQNAAAATEDKVTLGSSTVYLNSRTTITAKAKLAKTYGGIMVWELGQDAPGDASLLKAINDASK
ncbi:MAG TPA: glycosyl hydrolase family 18 protein [Polyangiaceae bacterium]|nr:glycosyl hydrolase family 18 protein [Polyangiaceae bacterium]